MYFLNDQNTLCERARSTDVTDGLASWQDGSDFPSIQASASSQLAVARADTDDATLYVSYQAPDGSLKLLEHKVDEEWSEEALPITDAWEGTGISVISGSGEDPMLFYQNTSGIIKRMFLSSEDGWTPGRMTQHKVAPAASLSAVAWNYGRPDFQMRLYTITTNNKLAELRGSHRDRFRIIKAGNEDIITVSAQQQYSAVAAIRTPVDGRLNVFYQPEPNIIGLWEFNRDQRLPLGLPISRGIRVAEPVIVNLERRLAEEQGKTERLNNEVQQLTDLVFSTSQERDQSNQAIDGFIQRIDGELRKLGVTVAGTGSRGDRLNHVAQMLQTELVKVTSLTLEKATLTQQLTEARNKPPERIYIDRPGPERVVHVNVPGQERVVIRDIGRANLQRVISNVDESVRWFGAVVAYHSEARVMKSNGLIRFQEVRNLLSSV